VMPIYFYSTRTQTYGCFSNFSRHGFELDELWWVTSEHYFQAQKFVDTDPSWFDKIHSVKTPKDAAKMGRDRSHPLRSDWEQVKDGIMQRAVGSPVVRVISFINKSAEDSLALVLSRSDSGESRLLIASIPIPSSNHSNQASENASSESW